ncbi:MAG: hydroxysqualene dehydroxylase HpnE, partial [Alphaproteobacteria bacterium]
MATVHVVGAGLAGLACAVRLVGEGRAVALYEAAGQAGGRCRSLFEPTLERAIDNGNHLLLGGNDATMAYLDVIGARDSLRSAPEVVFPFVDLRSGARWTLRPNAGPLPWWLLCASRRVPESRLRHYLGALRLARARADATIADVFDTGDPFFERFWEPLAVAVLNAAPEDGAARLLWPVMKLTFGRGGRACRAYVARDGLSASFVDPALAWLGARGCEARFGARLRDVERCDGRAARLDFGDRAAEVGAEDSVVLALPPARIAEMLPEITVPGASRAIVNAHFRLPRPASLPAGSPFLGLIGGHAQWAFLRDDIASVTVSAGDAMIDTGAGEIAALLWADVGRALDLPSDPLPPYRIVKERRATFAQTPAEVTRRPPARTAWANLFLAGDWTDTGLPATIESAVTSGHTAAGLALA